MAPDWWRGLDDVTAYDMATYLRCVFVESETALAVLTSAPGTGPERMLHDRELAGTRALFDRLGGGGRLHNHSVVQPELPGGLDAMAAARERYDPVGLEGVHARRRLDGGREPQRGWWLDDEADRHAVPRAGARVGREARLRAQGHQRSGADRLAARRRARGRRVPRPRLPDLPLGLRDSR